MSDKQRQPEDSINERLDKYNASAALDGKDLSPENLEKLKAMLRSGKKVDDCVAEVIAQHSNPR